MAPQENSHNGLDERVDELTRRLDAALAEADSAHAEADAALAEADAAKADAERARMEAGASRREADVARHDAEAARAELAAVRGSRAFRTGEALARPVRRLHDWRERRRLTRRRRDYIERKGASRGRPRLVVSLTSFPARMGCVSRCIETLLDQGYPPDAVLLWLSRDQFPGLESDLPPELLALRQRGLEIRWVDGDMRSHKKWFYSLRENARDMVVLADDDIVYPSDLIERLYEGHLRFPEAVCCVRAHRIAHDEHGGYRSYQEWEMEVSAPLDTPGTDELFATTGAGTLYPPGFADRLGPEAFDAEFIEKTCPQADDVFLHIMKKRAGIETVLVSAARPICLIEGSQEVRLSRLNMEEADGNTVQLRALLDALGVK